MSEYYVSTLRDPDTNAFTMILTAGRTEDEAYDTGRKSFPPDVSRSVVTSLLDVERCTEALYDEVTRYGATRAWAVDHSTGLLRPAYRYAYQVCFVGNGGSSFGEWVRPFRSKADATEAARQADGTGLRYGAFVKRIRITQREFDKNAR